ncbi:unnamed protein product [Symbiodinium sp. CCMP2592]|nr:unnamed protein product [Symbiodinium sp. CCMP2592]
MPNHGGRRRRSNEWEERRQAGSGRRYGNAMWQDFHMKRGEAYTHRLTEEEVYNREPEFHKVPMALLGRTYETPRMPPHFNHMPMQNGIGWGGFIPPPAPVVDHVQLVLHNIFLLQCCNSNEGRGVQQLVARLMLNFNINYATGATRLARYWVIAASAAQLVILSMSSSANAILTEAERGLRTATWPLFVRSATTAGNRDVDSDHYRFPGGRHSAHGLLAVSGACHRAALGDL